MNARMDERVQRFKGFVFVGGHHLVGAGRRLPLQRLDHFGGHRQIVVGLLGRSRRERRGRDPHLVLARGVEQPHGPGESLELQPLHADSGRRHGLCYQ